MYKTIEDIKKANASLGNYFFSPSTMRFFGSRVGRNLWQLPDGSALFVTSEQFSNDTPRRYTIRIARPTGEVHDWSEFQEYASSSTANRAAAALAAAANAPQPCATCGRTDGQTHTVTGRPERFCSVPCLATYAG